MNPSLTLNSAMVQAVLSGTKTTIRRFINTHSVTQSIGDLISVRGKVYDPRLSHHMEMLLKLAPHGSVGQRLWVRETWAVHWMYNNVKASESQTNPKLPGDNTWYKSDGEEAKGSFGGSWTIRGKWRAATQMPQWASRITLEVTSVHIERLQDINERDAQAEGVLPFFERFPNMSHDQTITTGERAIDSPYRASFAASWDETNGDVVTWKNNPWVWVIGFKRITLS